MMRNIAFPVRWVDTEFMFRMYGFVMSKIYWENVESLMGKGRNLLNFWFGLTSSRAEMYEVSTREAGSF